MAIDPTRTLAMTLTALTFAACQPSHRPQPVAQPVEGCEPADVEGLRARLEATAPDQRQALVLDFTQRCRHLDPELAERLTKAFEPVVIEVDLPPKDGAVPAPAPEVTIHIGISQARLDDGAPMDDAALREALTLRLAGFDSVAPNLILSSEADVPFERLVRIMDIAREVGFHNVILATPSAPK